MKWKILLRFLLILLVSVVVIFIIDSAVISNLLLEEDRAEGRWSRLSEFTLEFKKYIFEEEGLPQVTHEGIEELKLRNAWIQILDEEGYEVYHWNKPAKALKHYTPSDMVYYNIYSGAIDDYTTFAGTAKTDDTRWSYILGFPIEKVAKNIYTFSPERIKATILQVVILLVLIPIVVLIVMGYIFGRNLTIPVIHIINGIQELAKGDYDKKYAEKGVYKEVYQSLNHLSHTLKSNEIERRNIEKMREEWIQNLSHDLKTPLASIKGYGEILCDESYSHTDEEIRRYANIIREKALYMEELLEDLKLTQVLKQGLLPLHRQEENLVKVLRDVIIDVLNNPLYEDRIIHFNAREQRIILPIDRPLFQRAFSNLIYNALVHNHEDTEVIINIYKEKDIYVEIIDNGRGISKEELRNIFERYYRGTNTGESHKGTGLGLNIAKQIIEVHGGNIEVESSLGKGTQIRIRLTGVSSV